MRQCGVGGRGLVAVGEAVPFQVEIRMKSSSFGFVVVVEDDCCDLALLAMWEHANSHCLDCSKSGLLKELAEEWQWPRHPLMD